MADIKKTSANVVTKQVKYINTGTKRRPIYKRKCDMDLEIGLDSLERIDQFSTFIYFSGDGDYLPLYERLIRKKKKVIVVAPRKRIGSEVFNLKGKIQIAFVKRSPQELLRERG